MSKNDLVRETYDVPDAGKRLGLGKNAAYEAARRGEIPTIRIGRRLLVPKAAFNRMLAADAGSLGRRQSDGG